jgi:DtxR family Mn-dependent transcriptional regulator
MANPTTEDYIKNIYKLQQAGGVATTSALAASLQLADASVTAMIKKLAGKGYVRYRRYRGVELTPDGRRIALKTLRRHRLWEMYLVEFLGFSWDEIHDEAEKLEHATSDALERRLDAALHFPRVDPHGDPIPDAAGDVARRRSVPLTGCEPGATLRISRVRDDDRLILKHAARIGLGLGRRIAVMEKLSFDGSMTVKIGARRRFISREVAGAVFVVPA